MEMVAIQSCQCSSFIFFPRYNDTCLLRFHFYHLPYPLLRRRFRSYAARDSSGWRKRRGNQWDSNAETVRVDGFSFKIPNENYEEEEDEYDDEEITSSGILEKAIDSIWIFKVFKSYGWLLPPILLSLLITTGLKAFLMALALPFGLSVIALVFQKLDGRPQSKQKRKARGRVRVRVRKKNKKKYAATMKKEKMENDTSKGQNVGKQMDYQSWVNDGVSMNEGGQDASAFGGWDELDEMGSLRMSSLVTNGSKRTTKENIKLTEKESVRDDTPLLVRLLIAVFPFLGSWTKMFW